MNVYPDSVPAFHLAALVRHLRRHDARCEAVLARHRLSPKALDLPEARVSRPVMAAVLSDLAATLERTDLGFEMGMQSDLLAHPTMGRLISQARTLGSGLQRMAPYMALLTPSIGLSCQPADDDLVLTWRLVRPMPYGMAVLALEAVVITAHQAMRRLFPAADVQLHVSVGWAPPAHVHRYGALKGLTVLHLARREAVEAQVRVPACMHSRRLPRGSDALWESSRQACDERLRQLEALRDWKPWVEHLLSEVQDIQPSQKDIAALMGVSERTLARKLGAEGCTYRDLSVQVRHRRALAMLQQGDASISDISRVLGYGDSANFTRAFKALQGLSPQAHRSGLKGAAPDPA